MKRGDHGPEVVLLQEALLGLGLSLPRWGADGWYGNETREAVDVWASHHGIKLKGKTLSAEIVKHIIRDWEGVRLAKVSDNTLPPTLRDTREQFGQQKALGLRTWRSITGITLHQTATCFLTKERASSPESTERAIKRVSGIGVHGVVLRPGIGVWSHDLNQRVPQAQKVFNNTDIGIEIDGWFAGVEGDLRTFWKPKSRPNRLPMEESAEQTEAALEMIRFFVKRVADHGGKILHIHAHRQTSKTRVSDPGELVWKSIAIPAMEEHGLDFGFLDTPGPEFFVPHKKNRRGSTWSGLGPGRPIPRVWDPRATADY